MKLLKDNGHFNENLDKIYTKLFEVERQQDLSWIYLLEELDNFVYTGITGEELCVY